MKYVAVTEVDNDITIRGDQCVIDLQELYTALADKLTTEIEITQEFASKFFTYTSLCDFVEYSAAIVPHIRITVDDTYYDSIIDNVRKLKTIKSTDEIIYALENNPTKMLSTIHALCDSYMQARDDAAIANNKIATLLVQMDELKKQLKYKSIDYDKLQNVRNDLESKLHALVSRINFRYEKTVVPDNMFVLDHNSYNHILYIKEITRVHYTDTLVYYLQEILKTLYSVPVRTVVIEPYYAYGRKDLYKGTKPHWDLTYQDVYAGDIYMAGFQPKVMKDILQNPNHVNYLIVLDRGGYEYPHINCGNCSVVYTTSDLADAKPTIPKNRIISYDPSTMYIPYIEDFNSLSLEEKIQKYSSMNITKELIKLLEEVN